MIYTLDRPDGFRTVKTFGMVEATSVVQVSDLTAWERLFRGEASTNQGALSALAEAGPDEANAIVGVRVSTATAVDGKGAIHLFITYIGTPVLLDPAPKARKSQ